MDYVYIMATKSAIKIGVSSNPEYRLKQLQTSNSDKVTLVHKEPMSTRRQAFNIETRMLNAYSKYKSRGEWFVGLSVVKAKKTLIAIKKWHDTYVDKEQRDVCERIREYVGSQNLVNFINTARESESCSFVVEVMYKPERNVLNCLYAVTKPEYNVKRGTSNLRAIQHMGHINKHGTVFREYENWRTDDRVFMFLDEEYLLPAYQHND